jgi:hypothetical protein
MKPSLPKMPLQGGFREHEFAFLLHIALTKSTRGSCRGRGLRARRPRSRFLAALGARLRACERLGMTMPASEERPLGMKPALISLCLRGPKGPLFHGEAGDCAQ